MGNLLSVLTNPIVVVIAVVVFGYIIYSYGYAPYTILKKCGIKGPIPRAIVGNLEFQKGLGWIKLNQKLRNQYGPVAGYYFGCDPVVMVADPKILETIMIKKFDNFKDRKGGLPDIFGGEGLPNGLFVTPGNDYWWKTRSDLEPLYTVGNIQGMSNLIQRSCDNLVRILGKHSGTGRSVNIYGLTFNFALETCAYALFGRDVKIQDGEKDEFMEALQIMANVPDGGDLDALLKLNILQSNFPCLKYVVGKLFALSPKGKAFHKMATTTTEWLKTKQRATTPPKYKDMMQLMMDNGFPDADIVSQTINRTIGVYLNLANVVGYTLYLLALNPSVQDRLCSEIKQYFQANTPQRASAYDASQKLRYLDMVVLESVRMLAPVARIDRRCLKTTEFGDFTIPAGAAVEIPIEVIHHDPQIWPDPLTFDPDRHTPEKKAKRPLLSLIPLGAGPRDCIGKQLGYLMIKMALVEILRKYQFIQAADTEIPLKTSDGSLSMTPKGDKIYLKIASQ